MRHPLFFHVLQVSPLLLRIKVKTASEPVQLSIVQIEYLPEGIPQLPIPCSLIAFGGTAILRVCVRYGSVLHRRSSRPLQWVHFHRFGPQWVILMLAMGADKGTLIVEEQLNTLASTTSPLVSSISTSWNPIPDSGWSTKKSIHF